MINKIKIFLLILMLPFGLKGFAQDGKKSLFSDNGRMVVAEGTSDVVYSESLYIGPDADWQINGDLYVYSKQIWIAPTARIRGAGKLILKDPGTNPYYAGWGNQATIIDGNDGEFIAVNIIIDNPSNIKLADIADPGYNLKEKTDNIAALKVASNIDFNVKGGDILLNGYELVLGAEAQLLNAGSINSPNQNINGYVVTGNITKSLLIKSFKAGEKFLFPIGIDESSYTPAILTPQGESRLYVGVVDYEAAGANIELKDKEIGMDRVWHVFADKNLLSDYTLIHQSITNGKMYVDKTAEIMQYTGNGNWVGDVTKLESTGVHTRQALQTYAARTISGTWMTKLSFKGPVANDDTFDLPYADEYTKNENVFHILQNDDAGTSPIVVSSVTIVIPPSHGKITVNVDGTVTYIPDPGFVGVDEFEYSITDENGLSDTAKVTINVTARDLHIPNVFTPNGDGINDYFEIIGYEYYDRIGVTIVNRWGNEVYRNNSYDNRWEGSGLNSGTYFYIIEAVKDGKSRIFKGDVLIKRN
ncbi:gliding motility-associated C-terminal domain [Sphingobacterium spiritivorum]|uniref:Gliding motility-associated C-terminal domain n=1 Tax=Sphingobacterium spiritivorum TaxID=258 RepID=A0A380BAS8_SPHSI|nr:gliding motility-associated C-terminal domain-containing protein [Sphingobacterium spiritivorum]SUI97827.1 gliding motility-associated C-terminal domain [Sphingobacterium spiritivorum]